MLCSCNLELNSDNQTATLVYLPRGLYLDSVLAAFGQNLKPSGCAVTAEYTRLSTSSDAAAAAAGTAEPGEEVTLLKSQLNGLIEVQQRSTVRASTCCLRYHICLHVNAHAFFVFVSPFVFAAGPTHGQHKAPASSSKCWAMAKCCAPLAGPLPCSTDTINGAVRKRTPPVQVDLQKANEEIKKLETSNQGFKSQYKSLVCPPSLPLPCSVDRRERADFLVDSVWWRRKCSISRHTDCSMLPSSDVSAGLHACIGTRSTST